MRIPLQTAILTSTETYFIFVQQRARGVIDACAKLRCKMRGKSLKTSRFSALDGTNCGKNKVSSQC